MRLVFIIVSLLPLGGATAAGCIRATRNKDGRQSGNQGRNQE